MKTGRWAEKGRDFPIRRRWMLEESKGSDAKKPCQSEC